MIQVREASRSDVDAIRRFLSVNGAVPGVHDTPGSFDRVIEASHAWLLIAVDADRVVGTLIAGWDGWRAALYRLAVDPAYRRQGIARALVSAGEERLREAGARRIGALVLRAEEQAQDFWRGIGYEEDARVIRFVRNVP
jgi:ribosomal protein S18 acetylase RimI-like enzyme